MFHNYNACNNCTCTLIVVQPRGQLPLELLRETQNSDIMNRLAQRKAERTTLKQQTDDEDQTRFNKFLSKAKGFARKSKDTIAAKYTAARNRGHQDDSVELLPSNSSSEDLQRTERLSASLGGSVRVERGSSYPQRSSGSPPRDLFDDL